ncbi:MAG: hypothetical protein BGO82_05415 [Devosia sp. 67-54]|nr:MAG: hypothetical protein BGO82_05415 [Devosia sp. 67-54]
MTREIAAYRDPNLDDDFLWRLSIAIVAAPGPFSRFDGVDRTIALMAGQGMLLRATEGSFSVTAKTAPFSFDGEAAISCELIDGPTVDLNAMTRRGFFRHTLRREEFIGWITVNGAADHTMIVSNGILEFSWCGRGTLGRHDAVAEIQRGEACLFYSERPTEIFIVEFMADR